MNRTPTLQGSPSGRCGGESGNPHRPVGGVGVSGIGYPTDAKSVMRAANSPSADDLPSGLATVRRVVNSAPLFQPRCLQPRVKGR